MSAWGHDADALSIYYRAFEIADLDPDPDRDNYTPEVTYGGTTRPFRPAAPSAPPQARPGPEEPQPTPDELLRGIAIGMAFSLPLWFALVGLVLFFAQR